jgi:hypothetical protein
MRQSHEFYPIILDDPTLLSVVNQSRCKYEYKKRPKQRQKLILIL